MQVPREIIAVSEFNMKDPFLCKKIFEKYFNKLR